MQQLHNQTNGHHADADELKERPVGELMKQLATETSELVRKEIELAKAETVEKGKKAGVGVGMLSGAGLFGLLAMGTLTACFVLALDIVMPPWLAALIVTLVYGAIAAVLALSGKNKVQEATPPAPEQTIETVKEDVSWAKTQIASGRK